MPGTGKILWTSDSIRHHANRTGVMAFRSLPDEPGDLHMMPGCFGNEHRWHHVPVRSVQRYTALPLLSCGIRIHGTGKCR